MHRSGYVPVSQFSFAGLPVSIDLTQKGLGRIRAAETLVMERPPGAWYGRDFDMKWAWKRMSRKYKRRFKIKVVQPKLRINSTAEIAAWPR
jgi:hypothetical protein